MAIEARTIELAFQRNRGRNTVLTLLAAGLVILLLYFVLLGGSSKLEQALTLFAIWGVATVSLNLVNGTLGILSLGHHGFMLIGGYATALLILPEAARQRILESGRSSMNDVTVNLSVSWMLQTIGLDSLTGPDTLWLRFIIAIFIGGLLAAVAGLVVGIPSLRLSGDYLAIVTFGFGEIIRLSASTRIFSPVTNGALGFAGVPSQFGKSLWWTFGFLALTLFVMAKLKYSSYGRAMESIREDEIAAEAMGVNVAYHKVLGFVISAFFAGIAGGLWVSWLGNARLDNFLFLLTFFFLVAISAGGTGSITGVLLGTGLIIFVRQYGGFLEQTYTLAAWAIIVGIIALVAAAATYLYRVLERQRPVLHPAVYGLGALGIVAIAVGLIAPNMGFLTDTFRGFGMRRIALSLLLIVIMIFRPQGVVGRGEFNWGWVFRERPDQPTDEERKQDAWLTNAQLNRPGGAAAADDAEGGEGEAAANISEVQDEAPAHDNVSDFPKGVDIRRDEEV